MPEPARRRPPGRAPLTREGFRQATDVSRETLARLDAYVAVLGKWQRRINLVSAASLADVWRRHLLDSAQLRPHVPGSCERLVDLGSGAGFPGLALAILGVAGVELIEIDARKCAFLAEAARATGAAVTIQRARIESLPEAPADVITARACAPLVKLLGYAARFCGPETRCLFLKGADIDKELTEATKYWKLRCTRVPSQSDPTGIILQIHEFAREPRP